VTVREVLTLTRRRLAEAGCETPEVDAEVLVAHALGQTRSALRASGGRAISSEELERIDDLTARRERREPLAYVLGEWGFRRLTLVVDERVLVPRPETEVVVERALARIRALARPRVLDVGTGSAAIALAIADEHRGAEVVGFDDSADALVVARENAQRTALAVDFVEGDVFDGIPPGPWDLVVSNPPYVRESEIDTLQDEVRDWEPRGALVGDGVTEEVATRALGELVSGGSLVLEVADGDARRVAALLRDLGYRDVEVARDLAGRERVVEATKR
jgi:release factor glutamine methyltransferase